MNIVEFEEKIKSLVDEINSLSSQELVHFHQQDKVKEHIAITGKKGTRASLWIQPIKAFTKIDICPYGKLLEKEMYNFMNHLCNKTKCDGYKQTNKREPYWRVDIDQFDIVRKAAYRYAGLESPKVNFQQLKHVTKSKFIAIVKNQLKKKLKEITETEKQTLVKSRIGQNILRERILEIYDNSCAMCAINDYRLLRASHISKWSEDKNNRLNPKNVLCLCGLHDLAFEKGIIIIDINYNLIINSNSNKVSSLLKKLTYSKLKLPQNKNLFPDKNLLQKHFNTYRNAL